VDLLQIAAMLIGAALYIWLLPARWRGWALMIASVIVIYWLQPAIAIRWLDYTLPTVILILTILCWYFTLPKDSQVSRSDVIALVITLAVILALTITRYVDVPFELTTRPPPMPSVIVPIAIALVGAFALRRFLPQNAVLNIALIGLILLFVVIKTPTLAQELARFGRLNAGQDATLALASELQWLGFSYVAFRLIHTIRDRQSGILPTLMLREYITFVVFFPAYTAGPIDRAEHFIESYRPIAALNTRDAERVGRGLGRIAMGLFKKFVIADSLAVFSLSPILVEQASSPAGLWLMVYAYAFRIYFDFSGYTDIAIGIALLFGIPLPENFDRPYLKNNITRFWQSWHKTLSDWVRFYVYSPLTRALLRRKRRPSNYVIIIMGTAATMIIIGLWHEITLPFFIWGLWQTAGLFTHKVWSDKTRTWYRGLTPRRRRIWHIVGVFITFNFVALGWVWFALPNVSLALQTFAGMFGLGGGG
jgi:D-alanyl-lipoteichoic acid acyltransferase DltB (MBOAT superfamily)